MRIAFVGALLVIGGVARVAHADEPMATSEIAPTEVAQARHEIDVILAQMRSVSIRVRDDLRITRKRGTKVQIACVDQALSRADVATRRAREIGDEVLTAYGRGEIEVARTARQRLREGRQLQSLAARDGASCSAARPVTVAATSPTTVTMDVDPTIARVP